MTDEQDDHRDRAARGEPAPLRPRSVLLRWLHALWLVPLALLLLENLLLWTPAVQWAVQTAPPIRLNYSFAYTLIPGTITVFDPHITVSDRSVQMQIDAERVDVTFNLLAFRNGTLHVRQARAERARFRFRPVLTPEGAEAKWVKLGPPIDGIPMPPVWRHPERAKKPTEELWKIRIDDVDASLTEAWLGPVRLTGAGTLSGGFELHPRTLLEVAPTRISWCAGPSAPDAQQAEASPHCSLHLGETELSGDSQLELNASLSRHVFEKGKSLLDGVEAELAAKFGFSNLEALQPLLPVSYVSLGSSDGKLQMRASVREGELGDDVSFHLASTRSQVLIGGAAPLLSMVGPLELELKRTKPGQLEARLDWTDLVAETPGAKLLVKQRPTLKRLHVRSTIGLGENLLEPTFEGGEMRVEALHVPDFQPLGRFFEKTPVQVSRGQGRLTARVEVTSDLSAKGFVEAHLDNMGVRVGDVGASFAATLKGDVTAHPETGELGLAPISLLVKPLELEMGKHKIPWWFNVSTVHSQINAKTGRKFSLINLHGPSLQPFVDAMMKKGLLKVASKVALGKGDTNARLRFAQSDTSTRLDLLAFKSGRMVVDGVLRAQGKKIGGAFLLVGSVVRVGIVVPSGQKRVHPTASRKWLEKELARQKIPKIQHERVKPGHRGDKPEAHREDKRPSSTDRKHG